MIRHRRQPHILIVADDLTGAADCAARCRHAGMSAAVYLEMPIINCDHDDAVAISTDSRHLPTAAAATVVRNTVTDLRANWSHAAGCPIWYKKIDSTLRGNIGAELEAMLNSLSEVSAPRYAVVCPAFPAQGRGLEDGHLIYQDATASPHLPTLLGQQSTLPVVHIPLTAVRGAEQGLRDTLASAAKVGRIIVVDATQEEDIARLVAALSRSRPDALLVGSAGMVGVVAQQWASRRGPQAQPDDDLSVTLFPTVVVVGSGSPMARSQIEALAQQPRVTTVQVDPNVRFEMATIRPLSQVVLLHLPRPAPNAQLEGQVARTYAARLSDTALAIIKLISPRRVIAVGGDTTLHVLERLGIHRLQVERELLPGIPLTTGRTGTGNEFTFVLKAGNHGQEHTLVELVFGAA